MPLVWREIAGSNPALVAMKQLVYNAIITPDGHILESLWRHDYREHVDKSNGKTYMVDGGLDYARRSYNGDEIPLYIYSTDPHEFVRKVAYRLGYGKPGSKYYGTFRKTLIKDMSDAHLQASLDYHGVTKGGTHWLILLAEKLYRIENEITIDEN